MVIKKTKLFILINILLNILYWKSNILFCIEKIRHIFIKIIPFSIHIFYKWIIYSFNYTLDTRA